MKSLLAAIVLLAMSVALPASAGEVKLQIANGRVTLQATNATLREILAEWGRVGQVKIVNGEKVMGAPVTLQMQDVPEAQALSTLLRSVSGFMASPKADNAAGASIYDRIVVMAAPRAQAASTGYTPPPQQPNVYRPGMPPGMQNPAGLDDPDEPGGQPPTYPGGPPAYSGAARPAQPQTQVAPQTPAGGTVPQGTPGTVSPMPQVPGMPGQQTVAPGTGAPGTITQPVKKPGGPGGAGPGGDGGN